MLWNRFSSLPRPSGVNVNMCIHALISGDWKELRDGKVKKRWRKMSFAGENHSVDGDDLRRLAGSPPNTSPAPSLQQDASVASGLGGPASPTPKARRASIASRASVASTGKGKPKAAPKRRARRGSTASRASIASASSRRPPRTGRRASTSRRGSASTRRASMHSQATTGSREHGGSLSGASAGSVPST